MRVVFPAEVLELETSAVAKVAVLELETSDVAQVAALVVGGSVAFLLAVPESVFSPAGIQMAQTVGTEPASEIRIAETVSASQVVEISLVEIHGLGMSEVSKTEVQNLGNPVVFLLANAFFLAVLESIFANAFLPAVPEFQAEIRIALIHIAGTVCEFWIVEVLPDVW